MIPTLPKITTQIESSKRSFTSFAFSRKSTPSEILWSFVTYFLALTCLILIFISTSPDNSIQKSILSPLVHSIQTATLNLFGQTNKPLETFTFVPGNASTKFQRIDFNNLSFLSYYDIPINADGSFNAESEAYTELYTQEAQTLFQTAHQHGAKVLLTLSMTYHPDIIHLLNNQSAQHTLYEQAVQEIQQTNTDGITVAIEYQGSANDESRTQYTKLIKELTEHIHKHVPHAVVSVAIPDSITKDSLYDVRALSNSADKTMIMAYSFAVPEVDGTKLIGPIYGFNSDDYLANLTKTQNTFLASVPHEKLLIERAWYGNGNNYPLYNMDQLNAHKNDQSQNTLTTPLSNEAIERLISDVPASAKNSARKNLPYIAEALEQEGILNANVLAYALATIQHETANTFEPIDEFKGRKSARRLGYEGGTDYFGRGFIQLTHLRNYQKIGERIGLGENLVRHPELASQPEIAAKVLAAYFKDFGIAKLAAQGEFVQARALINPDYNGYSIAEIAYGFLYALA